MNRQRSMGRMISVAVAVFIVPLDWFTKYLTHRYLVYGEHVSVIDGFFNLVHVRNFGSAFGMFNQGRETAFNTWFFAIASLIGLVLLIFMIRQESRDRKLALFCLGLLLGGLIGNQSERFLHDYVTDFLDFYINSHHWPAFNVADSAISTGIVGYMIAMMRKDKN